MTDAVGTVIEQWAEERMKTRRIAASAFVENIGSQRVFAKNGFAETRRVAAYAVVKGVERGLVVLERGVGVEARGIPV
jgi:RimJ/RimL family protein N-acetyltransferase